MKLLTTLLAFFLLCSSASSQMMGGTSEDDAWFMIRFATTQLQQASDDFISNMESHDANAERLLDLSICFMGCSDVLPHDWNFSTTDMYLQTANNAISNALQNQSDVIDNSIVVMAALASSYASMEVGDWNGAWSTAYDGLLWGNDAWFLISNYEMTSLWLGFFIEMVEMSMIEWGCS